MIIASIYPCPFDVQDRHDMSVAILKDDEVYAYEEAKMTTVKRDGTVRFPERSLMMGCKELNIIPSQVDKWVFPSTSKPIDIKDQFLFFDWILKAYIGSKDDFEKWFKEHVYFVDHQISHAALAVLASNFDECAFLCQDGGGDFGDERNLIFGEYKNGDFHVIQNRFGQKNICAFHAFLTDSLGFSSEDSGKTTGLSAYGTVQPELLKQYQSVVQVAEDGINFERKRYGRTEVNLKKVKPSEYNRAKIFCQYPSNTNVFQMGIEYLPQDIAATGETILQENFMGLVEEVSKQTSMKNLVLSGGLFQNVSLNRIIKESKLFDEIYVPMAPSDAGLSLGAALYIENKSSKRKRDKLMTPFLGPSFGNKEIKDLLDRFHLIYKEEENIEGKVAQLVADGCVVGRFVGKGEYGPRSLGNRSILADPRDPNSKTKVNQLLKKRDWFMPYAPAVIKECLEEWGEDTCDSPYMQIAFKIRSEKRSLIPSAVHVDGSSRIQVVNKEDNPGFWKVIDCFRQITGFPVVLNTSFNRHGIATISSPRQAVEHFLEGCMDYLAIDNYLLCFKDNRNISEYRLEEKDEALCIREDCINRLKDIGTYTTEAQLKKYLERLSEFIGVKVDYNESGFILENQKGLSLDKLVEQLMDKVSKSYV